MASPFLVPFDGSFRVKAAPTKPPSGAPDKNERDERFERLLERLDESQRILYAHDRHALLLVFQAMDAAGKDGTIRAVLRGVDPAGCPVHSFKQPSFEDLQHDFLWRTTRRLPERGQIGVFNRSYYEEVLTVRVHPEYLEAQGLPDHATRGKIWTERFESIRDHEQHLARNGVVILKFWLNVSKAEQRKRFLSRLSEPEKHWKFSVKDVEERRHWKAYMRAYEEALNATSRPWAPWYAIPADDKRFMRLAVADLVVKSLGRLHLRYPEPAPQDRKRFREMRRLLD